MDTSELWLVSALVIGGALLLWLVFLARSGRPGKPRLILGIPRAMRPGQPDEVLEGPRLERIQVGAVVAVLSLAVFIPLYWLPERDRQEQFAHRQEETALVNGAIIYGPVPEVEEDTDPVEYKELEKEVALAQNCGLCHGPLDEEDPSNSAAGGLVMFQDPVTGEDVTWNAPPLNNVFTRWDEEIVEFTIKRGRPGTPMPAWGVEFGGPMTDQSVEDVMAWLKSLPQNNEPPGGISEDCADPQGEDKLPCGEEIFAARCEVCHGPQGQGKEGKGGGLPNDDTENPDDEYDLWYQGIALWKGDVKHLDKNLHKWTVVRGRRFEYMPAFSESPPQGVPIPPYPLTDSQIDAVVAYERTL